MDKGFATKWSLPFGPSSDLPRGPAATNGVHSAVTGGFASRTRDAGFGGVSGAALNGGRARDTNGRGRTVSGTNPGVGGASGQFGRKPSQNGGRSNRATSFSISTQPQGQVWPQLNSATLGTFNAPTSPSPMSAPLPETATLTSPMQRPMPVPSSRGFEDNFPSLHGWGHGPGQKSAGLLSPTVEKTATAAWGKSDVASKLGGPSQSKKKDGSGDLELEDLYVDPQEAAEISRLRALVPKLSAPKPGKSALGVRDRGKIMPPPKTPVLPPAPKPAIKAAKLSNQGAMPLFIANRPKLRSSMRSSPKHPAPIAKKAELEDDVPKSDESMRSLSPDAATSPRNGHSPSVSSSTNHFEGTSHSTSREKPAPVLDETSVGEPSHESVHEEEEEAEEVRSQASSDTEQSEDAWEMEATIIGEAPLFEHVEHEEFSPALSDASSRSTTPTSGPGTPAADGHHHHHHKTSQEALSDHMENASRTDPYASTFQYSASLEKEEQFLRSLGWDKSAYYDSDVDESEFVITEDEKKEFWDGVGRTLSGGESGDGGFFGADEKGNDGQEPVAPRRVSPRIMCPAGRVF